LDDELNTAVHEGLLGHSVALLASFELRLLNGIGLEETVELNLLAPPTAVVVELQRTCARLTNDGVDPARKPYSPAFDLLREKLMQSKIRILDMEPTTSRLDGDRVSDLCLDLNNVTHSLGLLWIGD
jgi:hypothetical protein